MCQLSTSLDITSLGVYLPDIVVIALPHFHLDRTRGRLVPLMQPVVTFLREAWKKWEQKRSSKRNVPVSTFNYVPPPRRSRAWSHQCASNTSGRTAKSAFASHKWVSIKRRNSSATVKGRTSSRGGEVVSLCHNARRESQPVSPLSCFTIPPSSEFPSRSEQDDRTSDFHSRRGRNLELPPLHLPAIEMNYGRDDVFNSSSFKSVRSPLSSPISPNIPLLNIVENPSTDPRVIVRGQTARITSRRTRMLAPLVEPAETPRTRHPTDRVRLAKTKSYTPYDGRTSVPPPDIIICSAQNGDVHDFPLSLFPQPPPLLVRKKVPKPLVLRPSRPSSSSSHGLLPYSPLLGTPTSNRPVSLRSISQTSISSSTKRAFGRPLTSVSPPPTSPPNSPLPTPPVNKRTDPNFLPPSARSTSAKASITQQVYRRSAEYPS